MRTSSDTGLIQYINTAIKWLLAIMMMLIASLTFYQIVMRYVFNNAPSWSEEMVRFLFIWCTFIAAAIGIREHIHIGVDVFVKLLPQKLISVTELLVNLGIIVFSIFIIKYGWITTLMIRGQLSPALGIPMNWIYLSVPVMGLLLLFYCSLEILTALKQIVAEKEK